MDETSHFRKNTNESLDDSNAYSHQRMPYSERGRNDNVCYFYSKYQNCKFGDRCRLVHHEGHSNRYTNKSQAVGSDSDYRHNSSRRPRFDMQYAQQQQYPLNTNKMFLKERESKHYIDQRSKIRFKRPCRYFQAGHCESGANCSYSHLNPFSTTANSRTVNQETNQHKRNTFINSKFKNTNNVCHYFKKGTCYRGDMCKFSHEEKQSTETPSTLSDNETNELVYQDDSLTVKKQFDNSKEQALELSHSILECKISDENNANESSDSCLINASTSLRNDYTEITENNLNEAVNFGFENKVSNLNLVPLNSQGLKIFGKSTLSETEVSNLRDTEITQFKKRFPKCEEDEDNGCFNCIFHPTDPDWPYDVYDIHMKVIFPKKYPVEVCSISVVQGPDYIMESLIRFLNENISEWLRNRHDFFTKQQQVELLFRPFLKWFDKNLNNLFQCGLKKDEEEYECASSDEDSPSTNPENANDCLPEPGSNSCPIPPETAGACSQAAASTSQTCVNTSNLNNGIKILFIGLELVEGAAALTCVKLSMLLHCGRCKTPFDIKTMPNRNQVKTCSKCNRRLECNFNPSMMHQFSNVVGNIHLVDCQAVDVNLVECAFMIDCLNCSKQVPMDGLHYGQKQKFWCKLCNQKLIIGVQSVKFQGAASLSSSVKATVTKKVEKKKDPVIKEGNPLPEFGTCKHYKKSYRWMRFPCCGKIYPCDICHDEKETGHEMKFANRMICGYCSKEQPYSKDKPCFNCSGSMIARKSTHWEGGKGCTNQTKMARNDKQKYAGKGKTISKKAQPEKKKKK